MGAFKGFILFNPPTRAYFFIIQSFPTQQGWYWADEHLELLLGDQRNAALSSGVSLQASSDRRLGSGGTQHRRRRHRYRVMKTISGWSSTLSTLLLKG